MKQSKIKNIRLTVQVIMLIIAIVAALNHYLSSIGKEIPWVSESLFHYICPICGVTSIYQFFASTSLFVVKLKSSLGIIISLAIMSSIIFGLIICGFICPFGAIQDLLSKVGKRIFKRKYNNFIPKSIDSKLKFLRYIMLALTVVLTATSSVMVLEAINPYHGFLSIFNRKFSAISFIVLAIVVILSLFVQRPWCKYVCPYGAFLGLFNKIKVFRVFRNKNTCISCTKCSRECPMSIEVHEKEEVRDLRCISCMECAGDKVCPKKDTISFTSRDNEEEVLNNDIEISNENNKEIKVDNLYIEK